MTLRKMIRYFAPMLIIILIISMAGCGKTGPDTSASEGKSTAAVAEGTEKVETTKPQEPVKIKFSSFQSGDVADDWTKVQIPKFTQETNIEVEHVYIKHGDTTQTLLTWIAAGTAPDCAMISGNFEGSFAAKGALEDLGALAAKIDPGYDFERFYPNLLENYKYQDKIFALPSDLDIALTYYNKDLFDKEQVPYPTENWTWADYLDAAKKLTKGEGPEKVYGSEPIDGLYNIFIWSNGGEFLSKDGKTCNIDKPEAVEALQFLADSYLKHKVCPPRGTSEPLFQQGKAAMALGPGPWYQHYVIKDVKFKWDVAPMPKNKTLSVTAYGSTFAILNTSKHKEEAWKFITWFLSDEQQFIRAKQFAWFPPSASVTSIPEFVDASVLGLTKEQKDVIFRETEYGRIPVIVEKQGQVDEKINTELDLIFQGKESVQDAVVKIKNGVGPLLK